MNMLSPKHLFWKFIFGINGLKYYPIVGGGGGGDSEPAPLPSFQSQIPDWAKDLPPETLNYIRSGVGKQVIEPSEYGISSQALQELLGYQPSQFQFPMADIQKALEAQQAIQLQQYQNQIRPMLANQGQLDSTYYADLLGKYLQGQQSQSLGNTANLLTQQALTNLDISKWLPQFRGNIAQALQGVGGARQGVQQYNLQYPYQTYIPALQEMYGTGLNQANMQYQSAMSQWQQQEQQRQQEEQQKASKLGMFGTLGGAALGALLAIPTGGLSLAALPAIMGGAGLGSSLGGAISPLWGGSGGGMDFGNALSLAQNTGSFGMKAPQLDLSSLFGGSGGISNMDLSGLGSSTYNPSWQNTKLGSQYNLFG